MSAIFGIINKQGRRIEEADASKIQAALQHRAVDGKGVWLNEQVLLGHHMLTITPEQRHEIQPVEDGDYVITADALIYNRDNLFSNFNIAHHRQSAYPDAALILEAYQKWGEACLDYLEGEFAFAIWDKNKQKLFCAVDQIGHRPFFYYHSPEVFIFSSEMKGVLAVKKTPDIFYEGILISYTYNQPLDPAKTYNDEIFILTAGKKLVLDNSKLSIDQYWVPAKTGKYRFNSDADWADCLRDLMFRAVENRLRTDMPVGISLSGGLDSSAIACIAGRILEKRNKPLYAFSSVLPVGHKGVEVDERHYIDLVGKHIKNLDQNFVEAREVGPFSNLERAFELEETLPNAFFYMDHAINKAAEEKNIRAFLSGFGGDFLVSWKGNPVISQLIKQNRLAAAAKIFNETRKYEQITAFQLLKTDIIAYTKLFNSIVPMMPKYKLKGRFYTMLNDDFLAKYKSRVIFANGSDHIADFTDDVKSGAIGRFSSMFVNRDAAFGMNTAMPMFDKQIIEFMLDVPLQQFRVDGVRRSLIRRAMDGILPAEIQWRRDKKPYSPDYTHRVVKNKQFINEVINSEQSIFTWKYIDKERMIAAMEHLNPEQAYKWTEIPGIRIIQGVICSVFLRKLKLEKYILEK